MTIKQLSIFIENRLGTLKDIFALLAKENINIRALSLADTLDFGILRIIVDSPEQAEAKLKEDSVMVSLTDVYALEMNDTPGGLAGVVDIISAEGISIEYMYAFIGKSSDNAVVICKVSDNEKTAKVIQKFGIIALPPEKIYNM